MVDDDIDTSFAAPLTHRVGKVLVEGNRITAVGRVQVASAEEARRELQRQLGQAEADPVRLTLANDYLEDMYVMPQ